MWIEESEQVRRTLCNITFGSEEGCAIKVGRKRPERPQLKINIDGSFDGDRQLSGVECVIRDDGKLVLLEKIVSYCL